MATNNGLTEPPTRSKPSNAQLLSMLAEVVALSEQLQAENNHLKIEWEQAFLRLEQNNTTIRILSEQKDRLENENDKLITKNNTLEAGQRSCPHKH
jgi:hypothetical protein